MSSPYRGGGLPQSLEAGVPVKWSTREPPLDPLAAAAMGDAAHTFAKRLLRMKDAALGALRGVAGRDVIVVMGETEKLPWVDGVQYLGRDPLAPSLLLPTALRPEIDTGLFEHALLRTEPGAVPLAVLPRTHRLTVISLAEAMPISRARLHEWLEGAFG